MFDYIARQKVGGTHLNFYIFNQLPALQPDRYSNSDQEFLVQRTVELTCTTNSMMAFAADMGFTCGPFIWDDARRHCLRAELDAYYAHLYELTRDELRYMLRPKGVSA